MSYKHYNLFVVAYVGEQLKKIRISKGLTRADVSSAFGYAGSSIRSWEEGYNNLALDVLYAYCAYLGVNPVNLLPSPQYIFELTKNIPVQKTNKHETDEKLG